MSLPDPRNAYSPRRDLDRVAQRQPTVGKVIPELKFVFWQEVFTYRHDSRLWNMQLPRVMPFCDPSKSIVSQRREINRELESIRKLRNRIAHHESIFTRNLTEDLERIIKLVSLRSPEVSSWLTANQDATKCISDHQIFKGGKLWQPSHDEIASFAFKLWKLEGETPNSSIDYWLRAEMLLKN